MAIKYTNIAHSEALQNVPGFFFWYGDIYHLATLLPLLLLYNQLITKESPDEEVEMKQKN
jgi:hypothetical protein